jgi:hypothetical protein
VNKLRVRISLIRDRAIVYICEESLQGKLLDPDEKVRAAVCRLYTQIDYETALHHVSESQLRNVAGRGVDKKVLPVHIYQQLKYELSCL